MKKYITLAAFFLGQGLTGTVISLLTLTSALVGKQLAPVPSLATLPITMTVLGSLVMSYSASMLMKRYGRKQAFMLSGFIGVAGGLLAAVAVYYLNFYLFLISTLILGCATVFNQYYRFSAAEIFDDSVKSKRATSLIIGGGIIGGILGPYIASKGSDLISDKAFLGSFIFVIILFVILILSQLFVFEKETLPLKQTVQTGTFQNYSHQFVFETASCAVGFALMTFIMNSAPLSMHNHAYSIADNSFLLQLHFLAMYCPSLFLPFILHKIKAQQIILAGGLFFILGSMSVFFIGEYSGYMISLICAGLGWSLMFNGGTFYINEIKDSRIKYKVQGINSLITYLCNLTASFSVGLFLVYENGWAWVNIITAVIASVFICSVLGFEKLRS